MRPNRVLLASLLLGTAAAGPIMPAAAPAQAEPGPEVTQGASERQQIRRLIAGMTPEEKVGQLFVNHVYGATAETADARNTSTYGVATPAEVLEKYHLGGVAYFTWSANIADPRQVAGLSNGLQRAATSTGAGIPLLISTDQETGYIVRIGPPATEFPGNLALGASRDPGAAYRAAAIAGRELKAMGINQDFAPVADVNVDPGNPVIGIRSYGADPRLVRTMTAAQVHGYEQGAGIAATAKHFPGHGDTKVDSHTGIPVIRHTRAEWDRIDAPPFRAAIAAGIDAIMTGHLVFPELDPSGDPATLSRPIMTGILREELGYDGVVITDSLGMQGVRDKYGDDRVPVLAINAGVDMLLRPPNFPLAYDSVLAAVNSGEISRQRLNEALTRILRLKFRNGIVAHPYVDASRAEAYVGNPRHLATAEEITARTTTVVRDDAGRLPVAPAGKQILVTGYGVTATRTVADGLTARGATATAYATGTRPTDANLAEAVSQAQAADLVVVLTMRAWNDIDLDPQRRQRQLVAALQETGTPLVVVATAEPHDIAYLPGVDTYLATYVYNSVGMRALTKVLVGEVRARGRLPIAIVSADDPDVTLFPYGHRSR